MKNSWVDPAIRDVWLVSRVVWVTTGLTLGLFLYTFSAFLYEKFGGEQSPLSLKLTILIAIILEFCIFITEVPTGAFADYIGRKKSVILSFSFGAAAFFLRSWIPFTSNIKIAFILSAVSTVVYALSYTFYSGALIAWMVDTLQSRNKSEASGRLLAGSWSYMLLAQIVGAVIGIWLYLNGYIFYAFALGCTASIVCAFFCNFVMQETENMNFHKGRFIMRHAFHKMKVVIVNGYKISIQTPILLYLIIICASFRFLNDLVNYLWPVAMKTNFGAGKMSPYWFLIVFIALAMAFVGSKTLGRLAHPSKDKQLSNSGLWIWYASVSFLVGLIVVILGFNNMGQQQMSLTLFVVTISFCRFAYGFLSPAYNILLNNYIPVYHAQKRATILSWANMFMSFVSILLMFPSSGSTGKTTAIGWMLPGGLLMIVTIVVNILIRRYQRKTGEIQQGAQKIPKAVPVGFQEGE